VNVSVEEIEAGQVLSDAERAELAELESIIERGVLSFVNVGRALRRVRDTRLYRETHATFEAYVAERFDLKRQRAYELIEAASIHDVVVGNGDTPPARESHAAALAPLKDEPEKLAEVWRTATAAAAAARRPVIAADVRDARRQLAPVPAPPVSAPLAPAGDPSSDLRFAHIEEGVQILRMLPSPDRVVWPVDEGDREAVGEAVEWLAKFAPALARAWREDQRSRRRLRVV
jgi:hypothetical protein